MKVGTSAPDTTLDKDMVEIRVLCVQVSILLCANFSLLSCLYKCQYLYNLHTLEKWDIPSDLLV